MSLLNGQPVDQLREAGVSDRRRRAFLDSYLHDRTATAITKTLFQRCGAFRQKDTRPRPEEVAWTGFNLLLRKAPFLDLPNWAPNRTWEFAVAMERALLDKLEEILRQSAKDRFASEVPRDARAVLDAFKLMADELGATGYTPSLFVLAGQLGSKLTVEMQECIVRPWEPEAQTALGGISFRIEGLYRGIPILDIPDSPAPAIYAVDLQRFARLTEYGDRPEFKVMSLSEDDARSLLERNPDLHAESSSSTRNESEAIEQLRLKVKLELFETYQFEVLDPRAVAGAALLGPVLEWEPEYAHA